MHKLSVLEMERLTPEQFREARKVPLTVVLDNVRSAYNVGSVLRTADGFRLEKVCMCGISGRPKETDEHGLPLAGAAPNPEIHKTALGAEDSVLWQYYPDTLDCVCKLREEGLIIVSLEQVAGSRSMMEWDDVRPMALVLGNEVHGVSQQVVDISDYCLEIPQLGTKHSFNVSCAAAMVMWQYFRNYTGRAHIV